MKRTLYALIVAEIALICLLPLIAAAATHDLGDQPFINYEQFHKPVLKSGEAQHSPSRNAPQRSTSVRPSSRVATNGVYNGRHYSKDEVIALIKAYAQQYGLSSETPLCIAKGESGFNQFAKNAASSASGVYQYLTSTWKATDEGKAGMNVFDAEANIKAALKYMASRRSTAPWVAAAKCPKLSSL